MTLTFALMSFKSYFNHCVTFAIELSRKPLEIEAWSQRTTNRKWPMGIQRSRDQWPLDSHRYHRYQCSNGFKVRRKF